MKTNEKLDLIKRGAGNLMVNVTAQGMAYADFLDSIGIRARRVRVVKNRIIDEKITCPFGTCVDPIETRRPAARRSCATCKQRSLIHESLRRRRNGNSISRCAENSLSQSESPASQRKNYRISDSMV